MKQLIRVTIEEASKICGPSRDEIIHYIQEEWINPFEKDALDDEDVTRIRLIRDLIENLGVNEESVPIILHLIDQIHALQMRMKDIT
jgi:chaperone modulatory protein CbpM